jgi:xanthine dehydrogenase accessory factor
MTFLLSEWPLFGFIDDVRPALSAARSMGQPAALATITALQGGGPRPVGTQMAFSQNGVSGFVSGGCLEADLADHAREVLADGQPRTLVYGEGSPWPDIRLLCGARIELLVERLAADDPATDALLRLGEARRPAFWSSDGARRICGAAPKDGAVGPGAYHRRYDPKPRLVVLGGDPTALAIATLGVQCGFETTLVRPKGPAAPPPIAGVDYRRESPAAALEALKPDPWTAVAVATHDAELDLEALSQALVSPAFYVGALGARRRLPDRLAALTAAGLSPDRIARLHAPIGLDIGGKAPWEVAVAVLAEITALRHATALSAGED